MSMISLLLRHGVSAPRIVGPSGTVTIGDTSRTGLQISSHTFHGGEEPEVPELLSDEWWTIESAAEHDRSEMAKWFPAFTNLRKDTATATGPVWFGTIDAGRGGTREIVIAHRPGGGLPSVIPMKPVAKRPQGGRMISSPHLYTNGNLCVASADDWNPELHTTATVVAWTAHWFACHTDWLLLGTWPSEGIASAA